ncbi:MAG: sortase [Bacillota bacterium]|nr:sortase [Bacillota bacterium]
MKNKSASFLFVLGLLLIVAALFLIMHNCREARQAELNSQLLLEELQSRSTVPGEDADPLAPTDPTPPDYQLNPNMEMPLLEIDGAEYIGTLEIPSLGLELPIRSQWSYEALKSSPCRYSGSAYLDDLIIAAHNYGAHFGGLKQLCLGEAVFFTDIDGNRFSYEVSGLEILQAGDVELMESGDWDLSLFTCSLGGSSRVTLRCQRLE